MTKKKIFTLRLKKELRDFLDKKAKKEGIPLNLLITTILEKYKKNHENTIDI